MGLLDKIKKKLSGVFKPKPAPQPQPSKPLPKVGPVTGPSKEFYDSKKAPVPSAPKPNVPKMGPIANPPKDLNRPVLGPITGPSKQFYQNPVQSQPSQPVTQPQKPPETLLQRGARVIGGLANRINAPVANFPDGTPVAASSPFSILGPARITGAAGLIKNAPTAVSNLQKIGTTGKSSLESLIKEYGKVKTSQTIATNTKMTAVTASWLERIGSSLRDPKTAVAALMGAIGSYPFAGFIKEEALQTSGFAVKTAIDAGDLEGAQSALEIQKDMLNPGLWDNLLSAIPYANVVNELNNFYDAAKIKAAVDQKIVEDLRIQQETGETDEQKWQRINDQRNAEEQASIDYYNQQRKQMIEWEIQAKENARKEEAKFWEAERKKQEKQAEEDRKAQADFWLAYRKRMQEISDANRPSNLKFGLL